MKYLILSVLMVPLGAIAQIYTEPKPDTTILKVEIKRDTLFVYRHISAPAHIMSMDQSPVEWKERAVYVIRDKSFYLLRTEKVKKRKVKIEVEEEYW